MQFFLVNDRLYYSSSDESESNLKALKYIPLDRISVRPLPHEYLPDIGICLVDDRQVEGCKNVFSVTAGLHTYFFSAETKNEVLA